MVWNFWHQFLIRFSMLFQMVPFILLCMVAHSTITWLVETIPTANQRALCWWFLKLPWREKRKVPSERAIKIESEIGVRSDTLQVFYSRPPLENRSTGVFRLQLAFCWQITCMCRTGTLHVHNLSDVLLVRMYLRLATARSDIFLHALTVGRIVEWLELNFPTVSQNRVSTGRPKTTKKTSLVQALDDLRTDGSALDGVDFVGWRRWRLCLQFSFPWIFH